MSWTPEPELLRPTPRAVERRPQAPPLFGLSQVIVVPFLLISLVALRLPLHETAIRMFGHTVSARVTGKTFSRSSERRQPALRYAYAYKGKTYDQIAVVDRQHFVSTPVGSVFPARINPLNPAFAPDFQAPGTQEMTPPLFAVFWITGILPLLISGFLISRFWLGPLRLRRLVQVGQPVEGEILQNTEGLNKASVLPVRYTPPEGTPIEGYFELPCAAGIVATPGQRVTVLCDLNNPRRALLYGASDWRAV